MNLTLLIEGLILQELGLGFNATNTFIQVKTVQQVSPSNLQVQRWNVKGVVVTKDGTVLIETELPILQREKEGKQ